MRAGVLSNNVLTEPGGGSLIHLFAIGDGKCQPQIPRNANVMTRRIPTPLFGLGLVEAIPDEAIRQLAGRPTPDGIRGRAALVTDPVSGIQRVGRFGWKAQQATILAFAGDAYRNEMGITNDVFPQESATGFTAEQLAACDGVADPQDKRDPITGRRAIDRFTNFLTLLAPPAPSGNIAMQQGAAVFQSVGCAACHLPQLQTGPNSNPVLDRKPVNAYSDFLLHDIRTGDGIQQGAANPNEFRTAPLGGLRYRKMLLHDGRALNPGQAIDMHDGDARPVRDRFRRLPPDQRQALLTFLDNL